MIDLEPSGASVAGSVRSGPSLIVVAAAAGGFEPMLELLGALPPELDAAIIVVPHRSPQEPYHLDRVIQRRTRWPVFWAREGDAVQRGVIYVAPHDEHLEISPSRRFERAGEHVVQHVTSDVEPILESAAAVYGDHLVAVVLDGSSIDAHEGLLCVHAVGGHVFVQESHDALHTGTNGTSRSAADSRKVLPAEEIASAIGALIARR
jgi:two-component system chemotaxis response regulator CheB